MAFYKIWSSNCHYLALGNYGRKERPFLGLVSFQVFHPCPYTTCFVLVVMGLGPRFHVSTSTLCTWLYLSLNKKAHKRDLFFSPFTHLLLFWLAWQSAWKQKKRYVLLLGLPIVRFALSSAIFIWTSILFSFFFSCSLAGCFSFIYLFIYFQECWPKDSSQSEMLWGTCWGTHWEQQKSMLFCLHSLPPHLALTKEKNLGLLGEC